MGAFLKSSFLLVFVALLVVGYFIKDIRYISLEDMKVVSMENVTFSSFDLIGYFLIKNPSQLNIPVKDITYDISLKDTGEILSTGYIPSFILKNQSLTNIPFSNNVKWVPAAHLLLQFVDEEQVFVVINGNIRVDIPKVEEYKIPFRKEYDIKPYVNKLIEEHSPIGNPLEDYKEEIKEIRDDPLVKEILS